MSTSRWQAKRQRRQAETAQLLALSKLDAEACCAALGSTPAGLDWETAQALLRRYGPNVVSREESPGMARQLWQRTRHPLNALLLGLAGAAYVLGDGRAALLIVLMTLLAIGMSFLQEHRSSAAAARRRSRRAAASGWPLNWGTAYIRRSNLPVPRVCVSL